MQSTPCRSLLIALILLFAVPATAQVKDKDTFVKTLFTALKNEDPQAFWKLFPDFEGFKRLTKEMATGGDDEAGEMIAALDQMTIEQYKQVFAGKIEEDFKESLETGTKTGIHWKTSVFQSWQEDSLTSFDREGAMGMESFRGRIFFSSGGKDFAAKFQEVIWSKTDSCWYGVTIGSIAEKGKEDEPEEGGDFLAADSFVTVVDTAVAPRPPAKKPVKSQTTKPRPAKPKTTPAKAPVRKDN